MELMLSMASIHLNHYGNREVAARDVSVGVRIARRSRIAEVA